MKYYLVVFRSRNETIKFVNILNSYNFSSNVISTPRQISVSCGISAKINERAVNTAKQILQRRQFYTYAGIYLITNDNYLKIY